MRPRFLLAVADAESGMDEGRVREIEARAGIRRSRWLALGHRITLFETAGLPILKADGCHRFVIGTAFDLSGQWCTAIHIRGSGSFLETMLRNYWGAFAAFQIDAQTSEAAILRDGSSQYPIYYATDRNITLISDDVRLINAALDRRPSINWAAVAGHLACNALRMPRTCLEGISELMPGAVLRVGNAGVRTVQVWDIWTFADAGAQIYDYDEAVDAVREKLSMCVGAWASRYSHYVLGLSGGLDSSIVGGLLAPSTKVTGLTLATTASRGDERVYARMVAQHCAFDLREATEEIAAVDVAQSDAAHLPRPLSRSFAQWGDRLFTSLATEVGADAFVSGAGGDNVFCSIQSVSAVADRLLVDGLWAAREPARDLSLMTGCIWGNAYWRGARRAWLRPRPYRWPINLGFLAAHPGDAPLDPSDHPWLAGTPTSVLPGKSMHIAWIMGVQNHLEGFGRERHLPFIAPLMSQPIVETCLRIPSWLWCKHGFNRSVAREAMRSTLPAEIVNRRSKGSPSSFMIALYQANRERIDAMLCGGLLAQHNLIDVCRAREFIRDDTAAAPATYARIMELVDVEAWARALTSASSGPSGG